MNGDTIRQGFLCPFCMGDFPDSFILQKHVDDQHGEVSAPLNYVKSELFFFIFYFLGVFGKAKQKFTEIDFSKSGSFLPQSESTSLFIPHQERLEISEKPQILGLQNKHTEYFKSIRQNNNDEVETMTNTLVIRLDKLINAFEHDGNERKGGVIVITYSLTFFISFYCFRIWEKNGSLGWRF